MFANWVKVRFSIQNLGLIFCSGLLLVISTEQVMRMKGCAKFKTICVLQSNLFQCFAILIKTIENIWQFRFQTIQVMSFLKRERKNYKSMKKLIWLFLPVFIFGCSKDEMLEDGILFRITDPNYPTSYRKLSLAEQQQKQQEFEKGQITFSLIDSFGFVGWSFEDDFDLRKQLYVQQFSDVPALIKSVKLYLFAKSEFTGIKDTSVLVPQKIDLRFQSYNEFTRTDTTKFNHLGINFGDQIIKGLEIYNSLLTISATAEGVHRVFGHWYPEAYIPPIDKVDVDMAKSVLVGRELTSSNGWGKAISYIITEEDLQDFRKIIYPYINKNKLELRVCWEFTPSHWQIFMDTSTGEILMEQDTASYLS